MYQEEQEIFPNVPICECLKLRQTRLDNKFEQTLPSSHQPGKFIRALLISLRKYPLSDQN